MYQIKANQFRVNEIQQNQHSHKHQENNITELIKLNYQRTAKTQPLSTGVQHELYFYKNKGKMAASDNVASHDISHDSAGLKFIGQYSVQGHQTGSKLLNESITWVLYNSHYCYCFFQ